MKNLLNSVRDSELLAQRKNKLSTARTSWQRGPYRSTIGTVELVLTNTLFSTLINFEELHSIMGELVTVVNHRPLTTLIRLSMSPSQ